VAVLGALAAIYATWNVFIRSGVLPAKNEESMKPWQRLVYNKYYVDEIYDTLIRQPLDGASKILYRVFDNQFIDGIVNGMGATVRTIGTSVRYLQTGNIGFYIMGMVLGVVFILLLTFIIK